MNPLLQLPPSVSHLPSSLIQSPLEPSSATGVFQSPPSAFTPLNPTTTQQSSLLMQPKLTIGNQQPLPTPLSQAPQCLIPPTQGIETTTIPPPMMISSSRQDMPTTQHNSQFVPPPSSSAPTPVRNSTPSIPPPHQKIGIRK